MWISPYPSMALNQYLPLIVINQAITGIHITYPPYRPLSINRYLPFTIINRAITSFHIISKI